MIELIVFVVLYLAMLQWGGLTIFLYALAYLIILTVLTIFMDTNDAG